LERFAKVLNKNEDATILINSHSDNSGKKPHNKKLSLKRATNVKSILVGFQVKPYRLSTWGLGSREPIASNHTTEGKALNRRVEFIVLYTDK
jgi:Outer membrane protein and related peptidoglycan-associated (lipo)proteins